jgi:hypothetical protein
MYHEATHKKAEAVSQAARAQENTAKTELLGKYLDMMAMDTSSFDEKRRKRHENALELFPKK